MPDAAILLRPPMRRWQFSLRGLLILITILCVALATFGAEWWFLIYVGCSSGLLVAVLALDIYVVRYGLLPTPRQLAIGAGTCEAMGLLAWSLLAFEWIRVLNFLVTGPLTSLIRALNLAIGPTELISAPQFWLTPWCMWRVLRRTPKDFAVDQIRWAAIANLLLFMVAYALSLYTVMGGPTAQAAPLLAFVASLLMAVPWVKLLRQHAMRTATAPASNEVVSLGFLIAGLSCVAVWLLIGLGTALSGTERMSLGTGIFLLIVCFSTWPVGTGLFAIGCLIELWRDRWHPWPTAIGTVVFTVFWVGCIFIPDAPLTLLCVFQHLPLLH